MYKLCFYVPEAAVDSVKQAIFSAGGGCQGHYDQCCWQVLGQGQFRPLSGSDPAVGKHDQLTQLAEWRVELLVDPEKIKAVVAALVEAHPYESPAYDVVQLVDVE